MIYHHRPSFASIHQQQQQQQQQQSPMMLQQSPPMLVPPQPLPMPEDELSIQLQSLAGYQVQLQQLSRYLKDKNLGDEDLVTRSQNTIGLTPIGQATVALFRVQ
jgi:hypothetical protein